MVASELSDSRAIFSWTGVHNIFLGERYWMQNHPTFVVPISQPKNIGINSKPENIRGKDAALVDAMKIMQVVPYGQYLQYWRQVTHFKQYVIHPVWEVETYGYVGDLHKHLIEELAEHVPIPPPQHLSFDKADTCLQESVDFTQ